MGELDSSLSTSAKDLENDTKQLEDENRDLRARLERLERAIEGPRNGQSEA